MPAGLLFAAILAQSGTPASADSAQLERIRRALAETPAITIEPATASDGRLVFRVQIRHRQLPPLWTPSYPVPSYIRPSYPLYHYDFLQMVTPEGFRASTLYPGSVGFPVGTWSGSLVKQIKEARRKAQEQAAREEVRQELAEVLACRADPSRPGC